MTAFILFLTLLSCTHNVPPQIDIPKEVTAKTRGTQIPCGLKIAFESEEVANHRWKTGDPTEQWQYNVSQALADILRKSVALSCQGDADAELRITEIDTSGMVKISTLEHHGSRGSLKVSYELISDNPTEFTIGSFGDKAHWRRAERSYDYFSDGLIEAIQQQAVLVITRLAQHYERNP